MSVCVSVCVYVCVATQLKLSDRPCIYGAAVV